MRKFKVAFLGLILVSLWFLPLTTSTENSDLCIPELPEDVKCITPVQANQTPTPSDMPIIEEGVYDTILVAGDEEFQGISYWIPPLVWHGWKLAAYDMIERADNALYPKFNLDLRVTEYTTWDSKDDVHDSMAMLLEAIEETGFTSGEAADFLVAFTLQDMGGAAGRASADLNACIVKPQAYWADDNLLQHEISHIYEANDHLTPDDVGYYDECVMSSRWVYVETVVEDGWMWLIYTNVHQAYLTENYCQTCYETLEEVIPQKGHPYKIIRIIRRHGGGGAGFRCCIKRL